MFTAVFVSTFLVPAASALILHTIAGFILRGAGEEAPPLASAAAPVAFLMAHISLLGLSAPTTTDPLVKIAYVCAGGLALGLIFDFARPRAPAWLVPATCLVWPAAAAVWIGAPELAGQDLFVLFQVLVLWVGGALIFIRTARLRAADPQSLTPTVMIACASLGVAMIGYFVAQDTVGRLALALASAVGAVAVWNWITIMTRPKAVAPFGRAALLGAMSALFAMAASLGFAEHTALWGLFVVVTLFFAPMVFGNRPQGDDWLARTLRPLVLLIASLIPLFLIGTVLLVLTVLIES